MPGETKLIELIEKAVSDINSLDPTDMSQVSGLETILDQISANIAEISDGPENLLKQAKRATAKAAGMLEKILQQEVDDTNNSIKTISNAATALQNLIDLMTESASASETDAADSTAPAVEEQGFIVPEDDVPLILDFITESKEHIESSEAGLLDLEAKPDDDEVLNLIFRAFHTIKGMAGFLNLAEIGSLAHSAENLLDLARNGKVILAGTNTDVIFESIDMIKKMINDLSESVEQGVAVPPQQRLEPLLAKLKSAVDGEAFASSLDTASGQEKDEKLDTILNPDDSTKQDDKANAQVPAQAKTSGKGHSNDEKIKVSTDRLDNLINMAGELVIAQLMLSEDVNTSFIGEHGLGRKVAHQGKIVRDIQELSMSMRMVPIAGVFQKMARLVRDLSHKAGKDVNFFTYGEDTELDRSIVDKIADPLVHMVRNSVDHGIESAEDRAKSGKEPSGRVELRAFHQAGHIVIEIEDDGKGLNKDRILKKAIETGVVKASDDLSDEEIFKLVFHAGLSTAEKITSVSGRGVGMDVVKKNIEALHGKIDIRSTPGKGTVFTIRMPLTLAIIEGQVVTIGNERYVIPINSIIQSLRPTSKQVSSVQGRREMVMVRGKLIPLVRLYSLFGIVPTSEDPTESLVVIAQEDDKKCCLLVDQLLGQQQVVIKNLGDGLGKLKGVSGGAIMGDGKISLILDIPGLIELSQN